MNDSIKKRLRLSNILAVLAMVLLLGTYTLKPLFEYRDPTAMDEEDAIEEIAQLAAEVNEKMENIGARRLHTILTTLLEDKLFKIPDKSIKEVKISKDIVKKRLSKIIKDRDLSRYIL